MNLAPVILFTYNRPEHLKLTIKSLLLNKEAVNTDLIVYCDAAKGEGDLEKVNEVRGIVDKICGFKSVEVIKKETNAGLAANIIEGVTDVVNRFGKVIVLEDDLETSPFFLSFMNEALEKYKDVEEVMNINAHVLYTKKDLPDTFFYRFANSWGWATWKRAWDQFELNGKVLLDELTKSGKDFEFDFKGKYPFTNMLRRQVNGEINSWAIRWNATVFLRGGYSLNAGRSMVKNRGMDGTGTNFTTEAGYHTVLEQKVPLKINTRLEIKEDPEIRKAMGRVHAYEYSKITKGRRMIRKFLKQLFYGKKR